MPRFDLCSEKHPHNISDHYPEVFKAFQGEQINTLTAQITIDTLDDLLRLSEITGCETISGWTDDDGTMRLWVHDGD